ncbi:hypothetical protein DQ239_09995 [Blastococcus sp. TF02-09]|uniref:hypothetical protein n=1 Tax=Blastococcus sp. TF02-09 TaxID=2250576 RepID=UPI000DE96DEA|nr:hypothetical protein [Blastococcus sp. TF02-9]RBY78020.1 hypothetical protein DQ239_09995 [Blastococcus sp. TF02-9]
MQVVGGLLCIVAGLAIVGGLLFIGPPGSRGHDLWTKPNQVKAVLAGVVAIVAGVLILTGGAD